MCVVAGCRRNIVLPACQFNYPALQDFKQFHFRLKLKICFFSLTKRDYYYLLFFCCFSNVFLINFFLINFISNTFWFRFCLCFCFYFLLIRIQVCFIYSFPSLPAFFFVFLIKYFVFTLKNDVRP